MVQSKVTSASDADDRFTVKKLVFKVIDPSSSTIPHISSSLKNFSSDNKEILLQNAITKKPSSIHLPPAFDDVVHVMSHSIFRVGSEQPVTELSADLLQPDRLENLQSF